MSPLELAMYIITIIPSLYFLYKVVSAAYYYLSRDDSDVLEE